MPSKGSFRFSANGRRKGFQSYVLSNNKNRISDFFNPNLTTQLTTQIFDMINNIKI